MKHLLLKPFIKVRDDFQRQVRWSRMSDYDRNILMAEKEMVRAMVSESLVAVISQSLCKLKDGSCRVAAHEIMLGTSAIRNLIRENKVAQMYSAIQTGNSQGMQTLDQNLTDLVRRNIISPAEARSKAKFPENFPG